MLVADGINASEWDGQGAVDGAGPFSTFDIPYSTFIADPSIWVPMLDTLGLKRRPSTTVTQFISVHIFQNIINIELLVDTSRGIAPTVKEMEKYWREIAMRIEYGSKCCAAK